MELKCEYCGNKLGEQKSIRIDQIAWDAIRKIHEGDVRDVCIEFGGLRRSGFYLSQQPNTLYVLIGRLD